MVINVLDLVPDCYSWENGEIVGRALQARMQAGQVITLSFEGVQDVPSSFVNAAFVPLVEAFGLSFVKTHLTIVKSNRQINEIIKHRLEFEATRSKNGPRDRHFIG